MATFVIDVFEAVDEVGDAAETEDGAGNGGPTTVDCSLVGVYFFLFIDQGEGERKNSQGSLSRFILDSSQGPVAARGAIDGSGGFAKAVERGGVAVLGLGLLGLETDLGDLLLGLMLHLHAGLDGVVFLLDLAGAGGAHGLLGVLLLGDLVDLIAAVWVGRLEFWFFFF